MPLYYYLCENCGHKKSEFNSIADRNSEKCSSCGELMTRPTIENAPAIEVWGPLTLEHIAPEPMTFTSKKQLSDYCKKSKCESSALL